MNGKRRVACALSVCSFLWLGTLVAAYSPAEALVGLKSTTTATGVVQLTAAPDGLSAAVTVAGRDGSAQLVVWLKADPRSQTRFESTNLGETSVSIDGAVAKIGGLQDSTLEHPSAPAAISVAQIALQPTGRFGVRIPTSVVAAAMSGYGVVLPMAGDEETLGCMGGGPGASSCSWSETVGGGGQTCTVTCRDGYYACCGVGWLAGLWCNCQQEHLGDGGH